MKETIKIVFKIIASILFPLTFFSSLWLKYVIRFGMTRFNDKIFAKLGVLPILDHYYQPLINPKRHLTKSLRDDRILKGINFNTEEQISLLSHFNYNKELSEFPLNKRAELEFYYNNETFCSGDAEYLYNMVRYFKPRKIIEIGSGASTLMVRNAIDKNKEDDPQYGCNHICVEPYEQPWLSKIDIDLIRKKVEDIDISFFKQLESNDILFIDSTHIIRPQGDVLFEFLEILPVLKSGVIIHVHDIFTPKDYLNEWIYDSHLLWNEQYLLEAFLTFNNDFRIVGALNYLAHNYQKDFADKCPIFAKQPGREPGSFWMIRK
jgi:hypothetical protein